MLLMSQLHQGNLLNLQTLPDIHSPQCGTQPVFLPDGVGVEEVFFQLIGIMFFFLQNVVYRRSISVKAHWKNKERYEDAWIFSDVC